MTSRKSESSSYSSHRSESSEDISQNSDIDFKDALIIKLRDEISTLTTQLSQANFQVEMVLEDQKQYQCVLQTRFAKEKESLLERIQELEGLQNYWRGAVESLKNSGTPMDSEVLQKSESQKLMKKKKIQELQKQQLDDAKFWKMAYEETENYRINSETIQEILEENQLKIQILEDKILNSRTSEATNVSKKISEFLENVNKFEKEMNSKNRGFQKILKNLRQPKSQKRAQFEMEKFMVKIREFSILETAILEKKKKDLMERIQKVNPNFGEIRKISEILNLAPGKSNLEEMERKLLEVKKEIGAH